MSNTEHYKFFQNTKCEFFPCHKIEGKGRLTKENFNCLFCFCPLYPYEDCGGNYTLLEDGTKDCSNCVLPHYNYDYIIKFLTEKRKQNKLK